MKPALNVLTPEERRSLIRALASAAITEVLRDVHPEPTPAEPKAGAIDA